MVASIAPNELQVQCAGFGLGWYGTRPHRVLHTGRLHLHSEWQALGIDGYMALTTSHLPAHIVAVTTSLFVPVRTDCMSMAPAVDSTARWS